jgi:hypothetical protein
MSTQKSNNNLLIKSLTHLLKKGNAHASLDDALENISFDLLGEKPGNLPYSIWQLAEHIRIAQWDILEFCRNKKHISPKWPDGYWPSETKPVSEAAWGKCIEQINTDRKSFVELLSDPEVDIYKPFDYGDGQTLLKEALVLADHNSYHTGEIIIVRRLLNDWKI